MAIPQIVISEAKEFEDCEAEKSRLPIYDDIVFMYGFGQSSPHLLQVPTRSYKVGKNIEKADFQRCLNIVTELRVFR
uniref:Copine domain-containing protein n=1 Tax=Rhabditophanes sp. KR3021 TaxID=114890 RepID=A0AC35TKG7_9BILA